MTVEDVNSGGTPHEPECSLLNFIYACSICGATFADTYEGHNETVQGFSDGINPKDRLVTKLYLSGCCHVFCGEHIEGGAPPFHPAGQKPRASCPFCVRDKGDHTVRDLYSIRGFHEDEHDPAIPPIWFTAPPMSLDGRTREMEALRFQYLALARYCQTSYRSRKPLVDALEHTKQELISAKRLVVEEQSKIASLQYDNGTLQAAAQQAGEVEQLQAKVQRLQDLELERNQFNADLEAFRRLEVDVRNLDTFRKNKDVILQYMKLLPTVVEQNRKMRERLASLGFAMALEPVPNHTQLTSDGIHEIESIARACTEDQRHLRIPPSSHTVGRTANTSGHTANSQERPLKRQRVDSPLPRDMQTDAPSSRDIMPPPAKSLSRMRSVRGLIPTIRKKLTSSRSSPKDTGNSSAYVRPYRKKVNLPGNQPTDQEHWGGGSRPHNDINSLCTEAPRNFPTQIPSAQCQGMGLAGSQANMTEFSFRAPSPVKMSDRRSRDRPGQLPTEPSYIRLMDGLSYDDGIELDLKDPRLDTRNGQKVNTLMTQSLTPTQEMSNNADFGPRSRWALGHAFLHQSPNGATRPSNGQKRSPPQKSSKGFFSRANYDPPIDTDRMSPPQLRQPARQTQDVVSSFFGSSQHDAPTTPRPRDTEFQTSSHPFASSRSPMGLPPYGPSEWHSSRSGKERPFIYPPHDTRTAPLLYREPWQSSSHDPAQSYQMPSTRGIRPVEQSSFLFQSDRCLSPQHVTPLFPRRQQEADSSRARVPTTSLNPVLSSRIRRLPSAKPNIISSNSARGRTQWETLQRAGVRSSRQTHGLRKGNVSKSSLANTFSRLERRSVRR